MTSTFDAIKAVLRAWQKSSIMPGMKVRHAAGGEQLVVAKSVHGGYDDPLDPAWDCTDDTGYTSPSYQRNLYPLWWPETLFPVEIAKSKAEVVRG